MSRRPFMIVVSALTVLVSACSTKTNSTPSKGPSTTPTMSAPSAPAPATTPAPAASIPKAAPSPAAAPGGSSPAAIHLSGSGQTATKPFSAAGGLAIFTAQCSCQGNFSMEVDDSNGNQVDIPINVVGSYTGSVSEQLSAANYILKIDADAPWVVDVTQPRGSSGVGLPQTYTGTGQKVEGPFAGGSSIRVQAQNNATTGNFVVEIVAKDGSQQDIPVNEIGAYNGSTISNDLSGSPYWLDIDSAGTWTVTVSQP